MEELRYIFSDMGFSPEPRWHQYVSLAFASEVERVMYLHGVRTGKTLCSLFTTQLWNCEKILVACPTSSFVSWENGLEQGMNYKYTFLLGDKNKRKKLLKKRFDVFLTHWEGLKVLFAKFTKGKGWRIDLSSLEQGFDVLILDEIHRASRYDALQSQICYELSKRVKYVIGLTGTIVDKSLLELFNIEKVVDLGQSLGLNFFNYRREFFYKSGYDWKPKKGAKERILKRISKNAISFERSECIDIPEVQDDVLKVNPSKEFLQNQSKVLAGESIIVNGNVIDNSKETVRVQRLIQLSGGFLYYKDDDGNKCAFRLKENPKLEALLDLINDTKTKGIIFYRYIEEGALIEDLFAKNKIPYQVLKGGQDASERVSTIKEFTRDPDSWLISQCKVGSEGWDGAVANVMVFYSPLASPRMREQCVGRISGETQKEKCLVLDLAIKDSVDEKVIAHRSEHLSLVKIVKEYLREHSGEV